MQRRTVRIDAGAVVDDAVALQQHVAGFLEADAIAAGAAVVGEQVAQQREPCAVHHIDADRVVAENILLDHMMVGLHHVEAIAALGEVVAAHDAVGRVPEQRVARVAHHVRLDQRARAVEDLQPVAAPRNRQVHAVDRVAADDAVGRLLQVDAKERVLDAVVLQHRVGAGGANARVLAVERLARPAHLKAAHRHVRRGDAHHVAAAVTLDHRPALAFQRERLVDEERRSVGSRQHDQRVARLRPRRCGLAGWRGRTAASPWLFG
ncbi:MAG: hypothetical protein V9G19_10740 [Tetrasphaera sp.]